MTLSAGKLFYTVSNTGHKSCLNTGEAQQNHHHEDEPSKGQHSHCTSGAKGVKT